MSRLIPPPLGIKPVKFWLEFDIGIGIKPTKKQLLQRYYSVRNAILRYMGNDLEISVEWIEHYNTLISEINIMRLEGVKE